MSIEFRIVKHAIRDCQVVEVWMNGLFRATLYPTEHENGVRFISPHIEGEYNTELKDFYFRKD